MAKKILIVDDNDKKIAGTQATIKLIAERAGAEVETVVFRQVDDFNAYLTTQPQDVIAVFADNNMYSKARGVEILTAAHQALPEAKLFWNSTDAPDTHEASALGFAGVTYSDAKYFAQMANAGLSAMDRLAGQVLEGDNKAMYEALFVAEAAMTASKSALSMARRNGQDAARDATAEALRPTNTTTGATV